MLHGLVFGLSILALCFIQGSWAGLRPTSPSAPWHILSQGRPSDLHAHAASDLQAIFHRSASRHRGPQPAHRWLLLRIQASDTLACGLPDRATTSRCCTRSWISTCFPGYKAVAQFNRRACALGRLSFLGSLSCRTRQEPRWGCFGSCPFPPFVRFVVPPFSCCL